MIDDEHDLEQYCEWRHEEERLILTWRCCRSDVSAAMADDNEVDKLHKTTKFRYYICMLYRIVIPNC